jgi:hypothetical protein|tara:strand:+ start:792 stop:941 length:150 start_codon:yes stop_codon:yes gene_type:complete
MNKEKVKAKTFLVREIPSEKWEQFKIRSIQDGKTCNKVMLDLITKYISR